MKFIRRLSPRTVALLAVAGALFLASLACSSLSGTTAPTAQPQPTAKPEATEATTGAPAPVPSGWSEVINDPFDSKDHDWFTGDYNGDYIKETVSIKNGKYVWDTLAKDVIFDHAFPDIGNLSDFYVQMDGQQMSGADTAEYGMEIRSGDAGDYTFGIKQSSGEFYLGVYYNEDWNYLIDYTSSSAIHTDKANTYGILAVGSHFKIYINGELVGQADDDSMSSGEMGPSIFLNEDGDTAVFQFDNFIVYAP